MKCVVLVDNNTYIDHYYLGEPAFSLYIEEAGKRILLDSGYSDVFIKNAIKLGIDLNQLDLIVLSHGHNDHSGGLRYLSKEQIGRLAILAHPDVFVERYDEGLNVGSPVKREELQPKEWIDGSEPVFISDKLVYLGPIRRNNDFEGKGVGTLVNGETDCIPDDSALAYNGKDGIFIMTGCSHSGICNIIQQAREVFKKDKIAGIIGGFHLLKEDETYQKTLTFFKDNQIDNLYPCHCVSLGCKIGLSQIATVHEVGVSLTLTIE